jgi:putative transposase
MPRPLRIHVAGAFYHVTMRGNHRQNIFFSPADRRLFDDITAEVLERFAARLHAYCWMTNHVHMLIQVSDAPLGKLMLRIAGRFARTVQRHLHTTGHLFEKRYHPILVDADRYLLELLRYIHLNPVRAHMVEHPSDYPWSSHRVYLGALDQPWVTTNFALGMFYAQRDQAIAAYQRSSITTFVPRALRLSPSAIRMMPASLAATISPQNSSAPRGSPDRTQPWRSSLPKLVNASASTKLLSSLEALSDS